ncbi:MAG: TonB-dependent receptor [Balneola sp.]
MKRIILSLALLVFPCLLLAQGVTTSSMSGKIIDEAGEPVAGATVMATHTPTGTVYGTSTLSNGNYNLPNLRVGGPYTIKISFVGFETYEREGVSLKLGSDFELNITMREGSYELESVEVIAQRASSGESSGAKTQISSSEIEALPNTDRDINDFLRLTPQSSGFGDGISFAGVNNRFNAVYIDGAVNNDVFGLAASGTNGGQTGTTPFSIDIIDQLQVVLSPYDVTYGGFAGGGINAVTKSGTNNFEGTVYTYFQNENFIGKNNGVQADRFDIDREKVDEFSEKIYGFSLGGPIIEDKLFFFTNLELQQDETPQPFDVATYTGASDQSDLQSLRDFLITNYDYDPGSFGGVTDNLDGTKFFGKLDYTINSSNFLTVRHQYTKGEQTDRNTGFSGGISFGNSGVFFPTTTNSSAIELNSLFGSEASNNLIISYVSVRDDRDPIGSPFPYVDIEDGSGSIRFGSEQFSTGNQLDQDIFSITNNFRMFKGDHTITIGTHNEFYSIYNLFIRQNFGDYEFDSLADFMNGNPASAYDRTYSLVDNVTGDGSAAGAEFNAMQLGFYVQDEWSVNPQLTLTGGLRIDLPIITSDPAIDAQFNSVDLPLMAAQYPVANNVKGGSAPDGQIMFSPRFGFNYDLDTESPATLRGGLGIFTSRIPFVWPGAMFSNNGLNLGSVDEGDIAGNVDFRPDVNNQYTNPNFSSPSGQVDLFTEDFKYPQIFRTNLGADFILPYDIEATVEGIYTKTLNNILYTNINSDNTVDFTWTGSPDNRPVYTRTDIVNKYSAVYVASNTDEGYTYSLSGSLKKQWNSGFSAMLAYTYSDAEAINEGTSSQNSSQWRGQVNVNGRNNPVLGRSDFAAGHRVISALTYGFNWGPDKVQRTSISLFANGQSGTPFSYVISGRSGQNIANETGSTSRNRSLIYIPETQADINLIDIPGGLTAAEQWEDLNAVIEDDAYLSKNRGGYAEKNASFAPFAAIFDLGIRQDLGIKAGGKIHKIQISLDISNVANMINKDWGTVYNVPGDFNNYDFYQFEGYEADGTTPQFTFREGDETGKDRFDISNFSSRWRMRMGVRYLFN